MQVITIAQKTTLDNAFEAVLTIAGAEFAIARAIIARIA